MLSIGLLFTLLIQRVMVHLPSPSPPQVLAATQTTPTITTIQLLKTSGQSSKRGDRVTIHYRVESGGTVLADTASSGLPFQFVLGDSRVPEFLNLGTTGLTERGSRIFTVPAELAGGDQGKPPLMPPKQALRVTVRVIKLTPVE